MTALHVRGDMGEVDEEDAEVEGENIPWPGLRINQTSPIPFLHFYSLPRIT